MHALQPSSVICVVAEYVYYFAATVRAAPSAAPCRAPLCMNVQACTDLSAAYDYPSFYAMSAYSFFSTPTVRAGAAEPLQSL